MFLNKLQSINQSIHWSQFWFSIPTQISQSLSPMINIGQSLISHFWKSANLCPSYFPKLYKSSSLSCSERPCPKNVFLFSLTHNTSNLATDIAAAISYSFPLLLCWKNRTESPEIVLNSHLSLICHKGMSENQKSWNF